MKKYFIFLLTYLFATVSYAQDILIDSDTRMEWYRDEQKIVAIGNAVASKEQNILKGDKLTAFYERVQLEDGTQKTQIQKIHADGNVIIEKPKTTGYGSHFEYDLPLNKAILTGSPAKIMVKQEEPSSQEVINSEDQNKAISPDNNEKKGDYTVYSDKMISYFDEDAQGKKILNRIEIYSKTKPVKIVNQQAIVTGNRGTYFPKENKLKLFENVTINQNGDFLKGDYAETDLKTGVSRLLSSQKKGRVSGIFHNNKKK